MDSHLLLSIFQSLAFTNAGGKIFSKQKRRRSRGLEEKGFVRGPDRGYLISDI